MVCDDGCHPVFEWNPTVGKADLRTHRSGFGEELGVYDSLLECVNAGAAEYGVIEYRFATSERAAYDRLVRRYGHRALAPAKYTASSFLGNALGQLWRERTIGAWMVKATGYWSYNGRIGGYASAGTESSASVLSWEDFARQQLDIDPAEWPIFGSDRGCHS